MDADDRSQRELRFHQLYQANFRSIQAYAVNRAGSAEDAADIVAEIFTTAWRRLDDVPPPPQDRLWLYGTARRLISRHYRSAGRLRRLVDRVIAGEGAAARQPALHAHDHGQEPLLAALGGLRPSDREALLLVYWDDLSYAEAATVLGCSPNAIGTRVHRAKARLRQALEAGASPAHERAVLSFEPKRG